MRKYTEQWDDLKSRCAHVLQTNQPRAEVLKKLPFVYTCPAREQGAYLPQWLWDSCFHAMSYRWTDPETGWNELQSLFVHQVTEGPEKGMIPHMAHLDENHAEADQSLFQQKNRSVFTQPPLVAAAVIAVYEKSPEKTILESLFPKIMAYHRWFENRRDPENNGLSAIIHPWESGWDASQRWDSILGLRDNSEKALKILAEKRKSMVRTILEKQCDAKKLAASGEFYVKPVDFNAIRAADLEALSQIAAILNKPESVIKSLNSRAEKIRRAIREHMLEERGGRLTACDLAGAEQKKSPRESAAKFILLYGKCVSGDQARLLRDELEDSAGRFSPSYRVPTTPTDDSRFNGKEYWRGNIWLSVNWLIYKGLRSYGYNREAVRLAENSLDLVEKSGFCEFFDPVSGQSGMKFGKKCPQNYGWSTIVLDMLGDCIGDC